MKQNALDQLLEQLTDRDFKVRKAAAEALGNHRFSRAIEALADVQNDEYLLVRLAAVAALGKIGGSQVVPHLIRALKDRDYDVRRIAAEGLARTPDPTAVESLAKVLEQHRRPEDAPTRMAVVEALGNIGGAQVVDPLLVALHDENYAVGETAARALTKIRDPRIIERVVYALANRTRAEDHADHILLALGPDSLDRLLPLLHHSNLWVRSKVARLLGVIGDPRAVEPLLGLLQDRELDVVWAAQGSLEALAPRLAGWRNKDRIRLFLALARNPYTAEAAIDALTKLAERSVKTLSREDLTGLSTLDQVVQVKWKPVRELDYEGNEVVEESVDTSRLRQLVRKELERRQSQGRSQLHRPGQRRSEGVS